MSRLHSFMFATGIENSNPTIGEKRVRIDQMEKCGHYRHWKQDFDLVEDLGVSCLRYGPPIHRTWLGDGQYDWEFADITYADIKRRDIIVITDLCHFGVPGWIGDFQNPDFPRFFARYAKAFATRYPYILAMHAILEVRPDAIFIQSESSEYYHAESPQAIHHAECMNAKRFLSLDLNYGRRVDSEMYEYLLDHGMTHAEYHFFLDNHLKQHCIMGNDYYMTNEHRVRADGSVLPAGEVFGYDEITEQYYERYLLPVMHTETNIEEGPKGTEAVDWLWKQWANVLQIRNKGTPIVGFTWYSLTDQIDWDTALREENNRVNPLGLYDLNRRIRPVGQAYKKLIEDWCKVLPTQSVCLTVPVIPPQVYSGAWFLEHLQRNRTDQLDVPNSPSNTNY